MNSEPSSQGLIQGFKKPGSTRFAAAESAGRRAAGRKGASRPRARRGSERKELSSRIIRPSTKPAARKGTAKTGI